MSELNPFKTAQLLFDQAAGQMDLDREARELLRWPIQEHRTVIPIVRDDGSRRLFHAHRVRYNDGPGPALGGVRWHPDAGVDVSRAIAAWTTWQCGVLNLPHGGAAGAVDCNPKELSTGEKERLARRFVRSYSEVLAAGHDVLMPDTYTTPQIMGWMVDSFAAIGGQDGSRIAAGKPIAIGGSLGQDNAIARGGIGLVGEAAADQGLDPSGLTFAVFGLGNIGRGVARLHAGMLGGGKLLAACDSRGGIRNRDGLDPQTLVVHKFQTGQVAGFAGSESITAEEVLAQEVDILYVAATPELIDKAHAGAIRARIVCELGDTPVTPEADAVLRQRDVLVLPDMLAAGGRLALAHFELVQNAGHDRWPTDEVHRRLEATMKAAYREVRDMERTEACGMRVACWMVGIARVAEACRARGWC